MQRPAGAPPAARSFVDADGDWLRRKPSLAGVVRSFVCQLRAGQDLTRVAIPAQLLLPFSLLELVAQRQLSCFDQLLPLNGADSPLERMEVVTRWYLSSLRPEHCHKKPYNPVLGETHHAWTEHPKYKRTDCYAEQVSHHPPVLVYAVVNDSEEISMTATASFSATFGVTHLSIATAGSAWIRAEKLQETYFLSRRVPDAKISNLLWGTRRMYWLGELAIACPRTGVVATLRFGQNGEANTARARISRADAEEVVIEGNLGSAFYKKSKGQRDEIFFNAEHLPWHVLHYGVEADLDPLSSLRVWREVSLALVENQESRADEAKIKVEEEQRQRARSAGEFIPRMFRKGEHGWTLQGAQRAAGAPNLEHLAPSRLVP